MNKRFFIKLTKNYWLLIVILTIVGFGVTFQDYFLGPNKIDGGIYTYYNNFKIFKQSYFNLLQGDNLYTHYPQIYFDLFKYSPSFALLFGVIAYFPDWLGLLIWNSFNLFILFFAVKSIPNIKITSVYIIFGFSFFELMTSVQNEQSNTLMLALIIWAFSKFETKHVILASLFLVLSVYTKLFGIVGFSLFLMYPNRVKFSLGSAFWFLVLFILPLVVINFDELLLTYENWFNLLNEDHGSKFGLSVMGWLQSWFNLEFNKLYVMLVGVIVFCIPLIRFKQYNFFNFRITILSSILIWVVIFNHMAESPSFIIAVVGVIIWYLYSKKSVIDTILLILVFILTTLSSTDLFPSIIREKYVIPLTLKAVPVIFVWIKISYDLLKYNFNSTYSPPKKEV